MQELLDLWRLWWQGISVQSYELWGLSVLVWGRIGKLIAFIGSALVIVELIGTERLRAYGRSLRTAVPREQAIGLAASGLDWFSAWFKAWSQQRKVIGYKRNKAPFRDSARQREDLAYLTEQADRAEDDIADYSQYEWVKPVALLVTIIVMVLLWGRLSLLLWLLWGAVIWWAMQGIVPIVLGLAPMLVYLSLLLIDTAIIRPTATLLENENLGSLVKALSLVLLVVGFLLDMLAS